MKVWALSGGGFKGRVQLPVLRELRKAGLPDLLLGVSVGAINGSLAAQDELDKLEAIWQEAEDNDDRSPLDGIKGFMSLAIHRGKGLLSLRPLRDRLQKEIHTDKLKTRFGTGIVVREGVPNDPDDYIQPVWERGKPIANGIDIWQGIEASGAVAGIHEPVELAHRTLSDGGHAHVLPQAPDDTTELHAVFCSPLDAKRKPTGSVNGLLESILWDVERAMHAAQQGDLEALRLRARNGVQVRVYAPDSMVGGMLDADRATLQARAKIGEFMARHPITV